MATVLDVANEVFRWWHLAFGNRRVLPHERICIDAWKASLGKGGSLVDQQLATVRLIQRSPDLCHVTFWELLPKKEERRGQVLAPQFPVNRGEYVAAIVTLSERAVRATIQVGSGRLFGITFSQSPRALGWTRGGSKDLEVRGVQTVVDPFGADPRDAVTEAPSNSITLAWVRALAARWPMASVKTPLDAADRERLVSSFPVKFPADYLELLSQADGLELGPNRIAGLHDMEVVPTPDGALYQLAWVRTRPGEELIVGVVPDRAGLFVTSSADHALEPAGNSLRAFLEQELSASSSAGPPAPSRGG